MLLDGYGLVYRGYFALPPLTTSKGDLVNGAFGFASIVLRGLQDLQPDYVAVSFDLPGPTFRHEQYAEYKATRVADAGRPARPVPEGPRDRQGAADPGLRDAGLRGRRRHRDDHDQQLDSRDDLETTIVTVDLDMLQLVTPRVRLMTTRSGVENTVMYDVAKIDERFGLRPGPDGRLQGAEGRPDRQHPGRPGRRREDRGQADPRLRHPRSAVRPARRGDAGQAAARSSASTSTRSGWAASCRGSSATCRSSSTSRRPGSATTTATRSSGCSASTSSGR